MLETIASIIPVNDKAASGFVYNYPADATAISINVELSLLGLKKYDEYCVNYTIKNSRNQIAIAQSATLPTVESVLSTVTDGAFSYQQLPDESYGTVATLSVPFAKDFFDNKQSKVYAELLDSTGNVLSTKETIFYINTVSKSNSNN